MAVRIALDTNRYRDFCTNDSRTVDVLQRAESVCLPFVAVAELRAGFAGGSRSLANEAVLTRFLNGPRVQVLYAGEATTRQYARLFHQLRTQGTPIPTNDIWIASLALEYDLLLFCRDHHFEHLPQLPRIA